jgi:hypothetical protein
MKTTGENRAFASPAVRRYTSKDAHLACLRLGHEDVTIRGYANDAGHAQIVRKERHVEAGGRLRKHSGRTGHNL